MDILTAVIALTGLGILFGMGLAVAAKKFAVEIDPRLEQIQGLLPGANCGACGCAGCFGFAEAVLAGTVAVDACRGTDDTNRAAIAGILGKTLEKKAKTVATLHCNGGSKVKDKFLYDGTHDCVAANSYLAGPKECIFGCIGLGTCARICPFGAIAMSAQELPVVDAHKCKACGKCVQACPKKLFTLNGHTHPVHIGCASHDSGKDTKATCPAGCIGCKLCEKACRFDAIHVVDNLAVIDYHKCTSCGACVKACPVKVILVNPQEKKAP